MYETEGFRSPNTRFIQAATLQMLTQTSEWTSNDVAYILLTEKARVDNWQVEGNKRARKDKSEEEYVGLKDELDEMSLPMRIETPSIPEGKSEKEMWEIFNVIFKSLEKGDELYVDVTHCYRYLPMLVVVMCNYAKFMKKVTVQSITYGNFEAAHEGVAPIMDVTAFSVLQDWTFSGASLKQMGKFQELTDSLKAFTRMGARKLGMNIQQLNSCLNKWEGQITTCRGGDIMKGEAFSKAKTLLKKIVSHEDMPQPLTSILEDIGSKIGDFPRDLIGRLCYAIRWCKDYRMVQQGYTLCKESIITCLCQAFADKDIKLRGNTEKEQKRSLRAFWSSLLGMDQKSLNDEATWRNEIKDNQEIVRALVAMGWVNTLRKEYGELTKNRNQVNHAGFIGNVDGETIIKQFDDCVNHCLDFLEKREFEWPVVTHKELSPLFLNLSNHPSSAWSEKQLVAARAYGDVVDMAFPNVPPCATEEDIDKMAVDCVDKIVERAGDAVPTVHVMGEMSLTFKVVQLLNDRGIRCVCSTTQRIVTEQDGKKVTEFQFERFREYC